MRAAIAFGSNLGDRLKNLESARAAVTAMSGSGAPVKASRVYQTDPVNSEPDAGAFLNAVLEIEYEGEPISLLDDLQAVEARMGRPSKRPRNAPRVIDLDLLYLGNLTLSNQDVVLPHPRLHLRRFVLEPLAELRPELRLPGQNRSVSELLAGLPLSAGVELYSEQWAP